VIESVIEFGALWKEVNPAAIFISALQFIQPSDWSRFLLLCLYLFYFPHSHFTLFISRTVFTLFISRTRFTLFISRTRFKLFIFSHSL
jgi:hypothetical protein